MVLMRCYKMTAREIKTFVQGYRRIHKIPWVEIEFYRDSVSVVFPKDYNISLLDILRYFLNPYINDIWVKETADEYYVYAFTPKVKKND